MVIHTFFLGKKSTFFTVRTKGTAQPNGQPCSLHDNDYNVTTKPAFTKKIRLTL